MADASTSRLQRPSHVNALRKLAILGFAALAFIQLWWSAIRPQSAGVNMPSIELNCGSGYNQLPYVKAIFLVMPPGGDCWSDWQVRPNNTRTFWTSPAAEIAVDFSFEDGTTSGEHIDGPLRKNILPKKATAVRFKNRSGQPITITVNMYYNYGEDGFLTR